MLAALIVLTQSRGSLVAAIAGAVAAIVLTPERGRLLAALGAVAAVTAAGLPVLARVYVTGPDGRAGPLVAAAVAIAAAAALLLAAGIASARLDARFREGAGRRPGRRWIVLGVVVALGAALWGASLDTRLSEGAGTGRYDFWQVSAEQLLEHPLQGAGAGNFAHDYARERDGREQPLYPHSVIWGTLGQTGLVGAVLLSGFFVAGFGSGFRGGEAQRAIAAAALAGAAAWLAQASIDWLWELPAVTAPAIAMLGVAAALGRDRTASVRVPAVWGVALAAVVAVAAASYALPALAARDVELAVRDGDAGRLDSARRLNPLSETPDLVAGVLALRAGDPGAARAAFARAVEREPGDWYAQTQLALAELAGGRRAVAIERLRLAARLNPLEPVIPAALAAAREGADPPSDVAARLDDDAVRAPLGRRPIDCRPVLGMGISCPGPPR